MDNNFQYCRFCGESISNDAVVCEKCGIDMTIIPEKVIERDERISPFITFCAILLCFYRPIIGLSFGVYLSIIEDRSKKKLGHIMLTVTTILLIFLIILTVTVINNLGVSL